MSCVLVLFSVMMYETERNQRDNFTLCYNIIKFLVVFLIVLFLGKKQCNVVLRHQVLYFSINFGQIASSVAELPRIST